VKRERGGVKSLKNQIKNRNHPQYLPGVTCLERNGGKRTVPRKTKHEHACSVVSRCNLLRKKRRGVGAGEKDKETKSGAFEGKW